MRRLFLPIFFTLTVLAIFFASRMDEGERLAEAPVEEQNYPAWMDEVIEPPLNVNPANVYTFTCEMPTRKPDVFTTACADFGERVNRVTWDEWNALGASGWGIYGVNDCDPNCAEGTIHEIAVRLWLEEATTDGRNYFLNTLKIVPVEALEGPTTYQNDQHFNLNTDVVIDGSTYQGAIWDVSRDWKDFPELRSRLPK